MSAIDPSALLPPQAIQTISVEEEFAAMRDELIAKDPTLETVLALDSEPLTTLLQACALRVSNVRQESNDRVKGLLLAFAVGADLDHIGLTYYRTARLVLDPGDPSAVPPRDPVYETDDDYRARCLIAEDGYSTAGPVGAYVYHAKSASGDVKGVDAISPVFERLVLTPEQEAALPPGAQAYIVVEDYGLADPTPASVVVPVLSRLGDGTPDQALLDAITAALDDDVRPLTDEVIVQAATIIDYTVNATLTVYEGFNQGNIIAAAQASLDAYTASHHELGHAPTELGVRAALKVSGVHDVTLNDTGNGTDMTATLVVPLTAAAYCIGRTIAIGGTA
jgi:phage-related baseplate assembly protein